MGRVLIVDDELGVRESLRMLLRDECEVVMAESVNAALRSMEESAPDLILLDLVMPEASGLELLAQLAERPAPPPVVVLTATRTVGTAVEAMKRGAADYVTKPFDADELRIKVRRLLGQRALEREVEELRARVDSPDRLGRLLGRSEAMHEVFRRIRRVAPSRATVLIRGESGTGKELVARAVHEESPRSEGPLVTVNCAAIPDNLIESELFGHERGAFTDAVERRVGKFELASGGTLFLDEIGELGAPVQAKLLRALQERRIERLGGEASIDVDVRVLAATNRDLERDVAERHFRADLFYRINVVPIVLPPLRERREDIRGLAAHFLERARQEAGRGPLRLSDEALAALERYGWPGNVRELQNAIEHAVALSEGERLAPEDLPQVVVREAHLEALRQEVRSGRLGLEEAASRFERELLLESLERAGWNQTRAASQLGISRRLLKLKMDRLDLKQSE